MADKDLFRELVPGNPEDPKEINYHSLIERMVRRENIDTLETHLGPAVIQRMLASLQVLEREATMHRLEQVLAAYGYKPDWTDPNELVFIKE